MSQLWLTFQEAADNRVNIGEVMDTWTRQMGFPVVSVCCLNNTNKCILNQTRFLINPSDTFNETDSPFRCVFEFYQLMLANLICQLGSVVNFLSVVFADFSS